MKIALILDQLLTTSGAERIFQYMIEEFSEADVYAVAYNPKTTWPALRNNKIKTKWWSKYLITNHNRYKLFFPVISHIMNRWDLMDYDLLISSSGTIVKYLSIFKCPHICYCFVPTRAIWNSAEYFGNNDFKARVFRAFLTYFQHQDIAASKRVSHYITISEYSRQAIKKIYNREAEIIFCPIDFDNFYQGSFEKKHDYYLIVSRLEKWKRLDYAIEAFNLLGYPLKVIGSGNDANHLKSIAKHNIEFIGNVDDRSLAIEYGRARAVIFTPELEYGLVPLEANAAGTPVIAYGKGAINETMVPVGKNTKHTALFFYEQSADSLIEAINKFNHIEFNRKDIIEHASQWKVDSFKKKIRDYVNIVLAEHNRGHMNKKNGK